MLQIMLEYVVFVYAYSVSKSIINSSDHKQKIFSVFSLVSLMMVGLMCYVGNYVLCCFINFILVRYMYTKDTTGMRDGRKEDCSIILVCHCKTKIILNTIFHV